MTGKVLVILVLAAVLGMAAWQWFPIPKEPGYRHVLTWGKSGEGPGELREPIGIAIAGSEVFVSEGGNNRIQVFDLQGNFLRTFGHEVLVRPMLMDIRDGRLYVADYHGDRIEVFTLKGEHLGPVGAPGAAPGELDSPGGVAVDAEGKLHVADTYNHRVQVLEHDGTFIRQIGETGGKGIRAGLFNYPTDVALSPGGDIIVADAYNDRIQVFAPDGAFLRKWGGPLAMDIHGPFNGWFKTVTAVSVGPRGNVFAADFYNHRVQKFTPEGKFLVSIGSEGSGPDELFYPTGVAVDESGDVYVVDFGNVRIQKFAPSEATEGARNR